MRIFLFFDRRREVGIPTGRIANGMSDQYTEHHGQEDVVTDFRADQADPRP